MFNLGKERQLPTLLLIDDDMVSREVMATVLTMSGYTVHTAEDGADAVSQLESAQCAPDVILMDAQMPGLSGVALIERLRELSNARIFAVSGSHPPDEVIAAADSFLLKPFGAEALQKILEQHTVEAGAAPAATGTASSGDPVVSSATLAQLRGLMPDSAVREIYAALVADLAQRLDALDKAVASGDPEEVRRIGHAIKGGCAMAGAMQAARIAALLETESNQLDNSRALLRDLRAALGNLKRMLETEFPAPGI